MKESVDCTQVCVIRKNMRSSVLDELWCVEWSVDVTIFTVFCFNRLWIILIILTCGWTELYYSSTWTLIRVRFHLYSNSHVIILINSLRYFALISLMNLIADACIRHSAVVVGSLSTGWHIFSVGWHGPEVVINEAPLVMLVDRVPLLHRVDSPVLTTIKVQASTDSLLASVVIQF